MTNEEADQLLANNPWAKWSDARELLLTAAEMGAKRERERLARQTTKQCSLVTDCPWDRWKLSRDLT
jgi:hypothetical protein